METKPTAKDVARRLDEIYWKEFAGRNNGKYRISRAALRTLSKRDYMDHAFIEEVVREAKEIGYGVLDFDAFFAVTSFNLCEKYRRVTRDVLKNINLPTANQNNNLDDASSE